MALEEVSFPLPKEEKNIQYWKWEISKKMNCPRKLVQICEDEKVFEDKEVLNFADPEILYHYVIKYEDKFSKVPKFKKYDLITGIGISDALYLNVNQKTTIYFSIKALF